MMITWKRNKTKLFSFLEASYWPTCVCMSVTLTDKFMQWCRLPSISPLHISKKAYIRLVFIPHCCHLSSECHCLNISTLTDESSSNVSVFKDYNHHHHYYHHINPVFFFVEGGEWPQTHLRNMLSCWLQYLKRQKLNKKYLLL